MIQSDENLLKEEVLRKITPYVAKIVREIIDNGRLTTNTSFSKEYGIPLNRLSELLNYEKGKKYKGLRSRSLAKLLEGGVLTLDQIKENVPLNEEEKEILSLKFSIYDNADLRSDLLEIADAGFDLNKEVRKLKKILLDK